MKKIFSIFAMLALVSAAIFADPKVKITTEEFSFALPSGWNFSYDDDPEANFILDMEFTKSTNEVYHESVTVEKDELVSGIRYTTKGYLNQLIKNVQETHDPFELIEQEKDYAVVRYIHPEINEGTDVIQLIRIMIKKNVAYIICATATSDTFDSMVEDFNAIVFSFK